MKHLILLRGLPGSGKSTLAQLLSEQGKYPIFSVDDYFTHADGSYHFDYSKNYLAYQSCLKRTEEAMNLQSEKIFIHNTFTMDWELEPYFALASLHHYQLHVVTVERHHDGKNIHDVSQEQLQKMADKFRVKLL